MNKKTTKKAGAKKLSLADRSRIVSAAARSLPRPRRKDEAGSEIFTPPLETLIALGSLAAHFEELLEEYGGGEAFERAIFDGSRGVNFNAVRADLAAMCSNLQTANLPELRKRLGALLPLKRSDR
jgi:hypothetical protein